MENRLKIMREVTPKPQMCVVGACPAIFESNKKSYLIIGKKINGKDLGISKRIAKDEILIEIPKELLDFKN